jgi:hypothetical protein
MMRASPRTMSSRARPWRSVGKTVVPTPGGRRAMPKSCNRRRARLASALSIQPTRGCASPSEVRTRVTFKKGNSHEGIRSPRPRFCDAVDLPRRNRHPRRFTNAGGRDAANPVEATAARAGEGVSWTGIERLGRGVDLREPPSSVADPFEYFGQFRNSE